MQKVKNPTVRITYAPQLENIRIVSVSDVEVLSYDQAEEKAEQYRQAWAQKSQIVLTSMQELLGLQFNMPIIDVALAPWTVGAAVSFPLIVDMKSDPDEFVDVLTHELFHVLFLDNQILTAKNAKSQNRLKMSELYGNEHSDSTLIHIPVHACSKFIYLDVHREEYRLERDIKNSAKYPEYKKAWNYVDNSDYAEIINKLKDNYKRIEGKNV